VPQFDTLNEALLDLTLNIPKDRSGALELHLSKHAIANPLMTPIANVRCSVSGEGLGLIKVSSRP